MTAVLEEDVFSPAFISDLINKILAFNEVLVGHPLHPYQEPLARRIIDSVLVNDGDVITALASRQSGKTETVSDVVATLMVLLPRLAKIYPELLGRFENGLWVGMFAPVEGQVETMFTRTISRLTSERATEIMGDPEIDDKPKRGGSVVKTVTLTKSGSFVSMMTANPRAKIESKTFHLIIIDECFPAETPVLTTEGWVPIGDIVNGDRRDWIVATQGADGLTWARVRTGYRTPRHTALVRVDHEHGSVYATANHPFMVDGEAVPAISLPVGARLSVVPSADQPRPADAREEGAAPVLLQHLSGAVAESHGGRRHTSVDVLDPPAHWAPPQGAGREWSRADRATAETLGRVARGLGSRACLPHWRTGQGRTPDALQDRRGAARVEDRRGDRRLLAHDPQPEGGGSPQGPMAVGSRVVGVQVLEPGSPEFDQFSDRADYVYTLEVESESHTYVAGGVLVGNCQEADDRVVEKSIMPMLAYHSGTAVKTGTPTTRKNNFYRSVTLNRRMQTNRRGGKDNHFEWDWKEVAKVNPNYERFIKKEMLRIGEDSDEFLMSYCLAPQTRVLTADLRHVPVDEVVEGQRLIGFDEHVPASHTHRKFQTSVVESVHRVVKPSYRVHLSDGTSVVSSHDHKWLVRTSGSRTEWRATEDLLDQRYASKGSAPRVIRATEVWDEEPFTYERGYLNAALEGEGHLSSAHPGALTVGFSQKNNGMLFRVRKYLDEAGFSTTERVQPNGVHTLNIGGGAGCVAEFLGRFRPERLLDKFEPEMLGSLTRRGQEPQQHPQVVSLEYLGDTELVSLETSTRTLIAEGLASHNCSKWILERGMLVTQSVMDELGDTSMQIVKHWAKTPVVVGIDPARKTDSTVVTVVWVDWDRPDEFGYMDHRVLNWLELQGDDWEVQYAKIVDFLSAYNVLAVGVDANGVGDAVAQRLRLLLPRAEVHSVTSSQVEQSKRYKHLLALIDRRMIGWPAHANTRRARVWKKFTQQMLDAEKQFKGQFFSVKAPDEAWAHDDFVDSLSLACVMTADLQMPTVEVSDNLFMRR